MRRAALPVLMVALSVAAANHLTATYGFVPVGFGLTATAGTFAAGVALVARDYAQDAGGWRAVAVAVALGAAVSVWLAGPALAIASAAAFAVAEALDAAVYTPLRRSRWRTAVVASSTAGALVDTALFLFLAFGAAAVTLPALAGQLVGKVLWVALPVAVIGGALRAVPVRQQSQ